MLVDSHCHLDEAHFTAEESDAAVVRAHAAGIGHMVTIGTHLSRADWPLKVAERHAGVSCTVGVHPHNAASEGAIDFNQMKAFSQHPKVVGIGECGLDYFYDKAPRDVQHDVFRRHIQLCLETSLPIIIHSRDSDDDMIRILHEETGGAGLTGIMHCFSSGPKLAEKSVEFGLHVSFSGILTFPKSDELRAIAATVPRDRLLVETDSPYLAPMPFRGKRNEPALIVHTLGKLAEVHGVSGAEMTRQTTENFKALFKKAVVAA